MNCVKTDPDQILLDSFSQIYASCDTDQDLSPDLLQKLKFICDDKPVTTLIQQLDSSDLRILTVTAVLITVCCFASIVVITNAINRH